MDYVDLFLVNHTSQLLHTAEERHNPISGISKCFSLYDIQFFTHQTTLGSSINFINFS